MNRYKSATPRATSLHGAGGSCQSKMCYGWAQTSTGFDHLQSSLRDHVLIAQCGDNTCFLGVSSTRGTSARD
jgi:hypothetical protein